jgi:hypothetical protein
MGMSKGV